jgi:crotonobetainyl-CoA:carnitine CoA-transferase CaiB-like acyl-CoA transferase
MNESQTADHATRLLKGYRALDLTDLKGQLCGRILGDLGMEVIKLEPPEGDPVRRLGPFALSPDGEKLSLRFAHLNANKKSLVLDYRKAENRDAFCRLAESADVVLESHAPGFLHSIGLGYGELAKINPRLVLVSITGFGQSGPRRDFLYNDMVVHAMSGLMYISGDPALPPCQPPETQAYYFGSLMAALGALAALYKREKSGSGDWVDLSMQEALATQEHTIRLYANGAQILRRCGSQHAQVAPATIFPCRDGYAYVYVSRAHWKELLKVWNEHPEAFDSPEWLDNTFRRQRAELINREFAQFTARHTQQDLTDLLQAHGIPCTPVNRPKDFLDDPHVLFRNFFLPVGYPGHGALRQPGAPYLLDGLRPPLEPAPVSGAQQEDFSADKIQTGEDRPRNQSAADGGLPLQGLRVLSFDKVLAGPYGMTLLAELGAEVIKVESRRGGLDPFRFFGTGEDVNLSPRFLEFNRNKRSVTIDLKHARGPALIKELVKHCDAVMDNFSLRVMPSIGLSYEELAKIKKDIVCLRMPGLGGIGPKSHYATVGPNINAFTGFTYLWNHPEHADPPVGSQTVFPDYVSGVLAATLITAASLHRNRTGKGVSIDLSQAEAAAFMIGASLMEGVTRDNGLKPVGNASPFSAPHGCYPCKGDDRWCVIAVESDEQWRALAGVIDKPELARDQRFATFDARKDRSSEIDPLLSAWTEEKEGHEIVATLQRAGIPCGVVQNGADLVSDEHLKARGFLVEQSNERIGQIVLPGFPLRFHSCRIEPVWEFPELGRDNQLVLATVLGYDSEKILELTRAGVLA